MTARRFTKRESIPNEHSKRGLGGESLQLTNGPLKKSSPNSLQLEAMS